MSKRMKGFTCCGDCIHYNYKKHRCNLGASIVTDARDSFYDDCPIPDIPSEQEIRNKAIEEFANRISKIVGTRINNNEWLGNCNKVLELRIVKDEIKRIAEQMKDIIKYDKSTSKWFESHIGAQTTVCRCDKCGLFYKTSLGHKCEEMSSR